MKVELKNVKHLVSNSRETDCFTATLYIDGVRAAHASNDGNGGPTTLRFIERGLEKPLRDHIKGLLPLKTESGDLPYDLDLYVSLLLNRQMVGKQLKKHFKTETLFRLKGDKKGEYRSIRSPFGPGVKKYIDDKYGDQVEEIANEVYA